MGTLSNKLITLRKTGLRKALFYWYLRLVERIVARKASLGAPALMRVQPPQCQYPLYIRAGTSDLSVFYQIFFENEYQCVADLQNITSVLDCGANVGYSSAYFLNRFPQATVIAVEPDSGNFGMLQKNTAGFGERIKPVCAGVWSKEADLVVRPGGDHREWGFVVVEAAPGEKPDVRGRSIDGLLRDGGFAQVDLLKMDIEGSEGVVFSERSEAWLPAVKNIVVEIHGAELEAAVDKEVAAYPHTKNKHGELTIYRMGKAA